MGQGNARRRARRCPLVLAGSLVGLCMSRLAAAEPPSDGVSDAPATVRVLAMPAMGAVRSIAGLGPSDVWLLDDEGDVVHHDGARTLGTDRRPCRSGPHRELGTNLGWLVATARGPKLINTATLGDDPVTLVVGERSAAGWTCHEDKAFAPLFVAHGGGAAWSIACGISAEVYCNPFRLDGADAPRSLPWLASEVTALWVGGPTMAWLARADGTFDYNGVGWHRRGMPPGVAHVWQLAQDDAGVAWALGSSSGDDPWIPGSLDRLARFRAGDWQAAELPAGFEPRLLAAVSGSPAAAGSSGAGGAVWLLGDGVGYLRDGESWRRAALPLARVHAAWSSPDGSLWVGGSDGSSGSRGMVARISPVSAAQAPAGTGAP